MKNVIKLIAAAVATSFLVGCETTYVSNNKKYCLDDRGTYIECGLIHLEKEKTIYDNHQVSTSDSKLFIPDEHFIVIKDYAEQIAFDLFQKMSHMQSLGSISITSYVQFDSTLGNTNALGNQLAELLMTEMQGLGLPVTDHKLTGQIKISPDGDFAMSRDLMNLKQNQNISYVLTGTMIKSPNGVLISSRVIDLQSNQVIASNSKTLPDWLILGMM